MKKWLGTLALGLLLAAPTVALAECPTLAPIGDKTVTAGQLLTFTATATDPDAGQTLTFSLINLVPTGAAIDPITGVFTWTPATGPAASDVTVQVSDNGDPPCAVNEVIHVTVLEAAPQNQCPVLSPIGDKTTTVGQLLTFTATATDADAGQTLTFSLINLVPTGAAIDPSTGVFTWTPSAVGASDVTVQVSDNAAEPCSVNEIIHVTVLEPVQLNQCPVLSPIGDKTVTAGQLLTFTATATDADAGQMLTFSLINLVPTGAAIDPATGVFTWTPATGPAASDVTVQVSDNAAEPCAVSEIIHVTVQAAPENQCPVLAPIGDKTVTVGQLLTFTATATDADSDTLTFSLINLIPAGAAIDAHTGVFTWTPSAAGASDVTVQVADNAATPCTDSEVIHVTVTEQAAGFETKAELIGALNPHRKFLCFRIWQSDAGFDLSKIDLSTLTLTYNGQSIDDLASRTHFGCDGDDDSENVMTSLQSHGHGKGNDRNNGDGKGNGKNKGNVGNKGGGGDEEGCGDCEDDDEDCSASQLHACFSMSDITGLVGSGNLQAGLLASEIHGSLLTGETFVATIGGKHVNNPPGNGNHEDLKQSPLKVKVRPNPMNPSAAITFTLANPGRVRIALYDLQGRLIKTILDESRNAGDNTVSWNGSSDRSGRVSSGVYFLRVTANQGEDVQRVMVVK